MTTEGGGVKLLLLLCTGDNEGGCMVLVSLEMGGLGLPPSNTVGLVGWGLAGNILYCSDVEDPVLEGVLSVAGLDSSRPGLLF